MRGNRLPRVAEWSIATDCKSVGLVPTGVRIPLLGLEKKLKTKNFMSKRLKYLLLVFVAVFVIWSVSGGISVSKEKSTPKALWTALGSGNSNSGNLDDDKDGLTNEEEKKYGTDPKNPDTDGDGFLDGAEVKNGFDPLRAAPNDRTIDNGNANTNTNANYNQNMQNSVLINNQANKNINSPSEVNGISVENNNSNISENSRISIAGDSASQADTNSSNLTIEVQNKMDSFIANYKLYANTYDNLTEADRTSLDQEINAFVGEMIKKSGLDFAFVIPTESLKVNADGGKNWPEYLTEVKIILQENGLIQENQIIEDGVSDLTLEITKMSKGDLDWNRLANLKKATDKSYQQIIAITVNPSLENTHIQLLRILKSLGIVLDNVNQNDYFRSYLAAGRAGKISEEIQKFSAEVGKLK